MKVLQEKKIWLCSSSFDLIIDEQKNNAFNRLTTIETMINVVMNNISSSPKRMCCC